MCNIGTSSIMTIMLMCVMRVACGTEEVVDLPLTEEQATDLASDICYDLFRTKVSTLDQHVRDFTFLLMSTTYE